jgi:hypothetical protein
MTVCVTGDVHHMSLDTRDQAHMDGTEVEAAIEYAELAADHGVPVTLFLTGKAVVEEPDRVDALAAIEGVELAGHNYYAFGTLAHTAFRGLTGSWHGPRRVQDWEIGRTLSTFSDRDIDVTCWRDHAYRHDANTAELLADHGITHFSDAVGPDERVRREDGLTIVPINTPPDHEHVYHAFRTPAFVAEDGFSGPFGEASTDVDEWANRVTALVEERADAGDPATVLAHPACMRLADGFEAFESLCADLGDRFETLPMSQVTAGD